MIRTGGADDVDVADGEGLGVGVGVIDAVGPAVEPGPGAEPAPGAALSVLCDEWLRPTATTAPAVPPAISTHPTANAVIAARLRPAPGIPTSGNSGTSEFDERQ